MCGVGVFCKMDMVGYLWVFISNEYFIGKRILIFLVLFDLSKEDKEVENDLFYYLGCLKVREIKCGMFCYCLEVVLIVIYVDKMVSDLMYCVSVYFRRVWECF